eukprot:728336-Amphidinium_carterae.1
MSSGAYILWGFKRSVSCIFQGVCFMHKRLFLMGQNLDTAGCLTRHWPMLESHGARAGHLSSLL